MYIYRGKLDEYTSYCWMKTQKTFLDGKLNLGTATKTTCIVAM